MLKRAIKTLSLLWYAFLLSWVVPSIALAQNNSLSFDNYSIDKGLSQASGFAATQDREGYVWLGTQDGLNRFDGYTFSTFRKSADTTVGLLSNVINDVFSDSKGRLWVATTEGVSVRQVRSNTFTIFQPLKGKVMHRILEDADGFIWAVTFDSGIYRISPDAQTVQSFFSTGEYAQKMIDIAKSPTGELMVAGRTALFKWHKDKQHFEILSLKTVVGKTEKDMTIRAFDFDALGNLWIGGFDNGLFVVKKAENGQYVAQPFLSNPTNPNSLTSNAITEIYRTRNGDMWIGTRDGLTVFNQTTQQFYRYQHQENDPLSISRDYVITVFEDRQGLVWVGVSGGGFCKVDKAKNRFQWGRRQPSAAQPRVDNIVYAIRQTADGTLYFGTQNDGLVRYQNGIYTNFKNNPKNRQSLIQNSVNGIAESNDGHLWLATLGGLASFDPKKGRFEALTQSKEDSTVRLFSVHLLKNTHTLLVSGQKGVFKFDILSKKWQAFTPPLKPAPNIKGKEIPSNSIIGRCFFEDDCGNVWIGSEGKGLVFYDKTTETFTQFEMPAATVRSIWGLSKGSNKLWVGTDNGLVCFDTDLSRNNREGGQILKIFNTYNGLPNNVVYGLLPEGDKYLWVSTNLGLARLDIEKEQFSIFNALDGLQGDEFNTNAAFLGTKGQLLFGGLNGVSSFFPEKITSNSYKPAVKITHFRVFNQEIPFADTEVLELNYTQNFFSLELAALNYSMSHKNTYAYKLEGIDKDWVFPNTNRLVTYTNLPHGDYVFTARAANNDGVWSDKEVQLRISIKPPYWKTFWFRLLLIIGILGIVFWLAKNRLKQIKFAADLKQKEAELKRKEAETAKLRAEFQQKIAETELAALRAQMNPHFIFNCLNSLNLYILENNIDLASDYLQRFSKLIRLVLENSRLERIPLSNEVEALRLYMLLESMRFKEKLTFSIEIDPHIDVEMVEIPPLLLQPFIENAIWHGLMHRTGGGSILLKISQLNEKIIHAEIIDNGIGRAAAALIKSKSATRQKSFGMKVTSERIAAINQIYHTATKVEVIDLVDKKGEACGTKVVVEIPI